MDASCSSTTDSSAALSETVDFNCEVSAEPGFVSSSAKKLNLLRNTLGASVASIMTSDDSDVSTSGDDEDCSPDESSSFGYVLFDTNIFINLINSIGKCEKCGCNVNTIHQLQEKRGFCHSFKIVCVNSNCKWFKYCLTSEEVKKDEVTRGRKIYDVNIRSVIACREIGK